MSDRLSAPEGGRRKYADLFFVSFAILFFELTCIRWFGSMVIYLTFFTNLVLMASFLGMSVGCMAASRKENYINAVLPLALVSVGLSVVSLVVFTKLADRVGVDVGRQGSPQEIFFGTEPPRGALLQINVPIELIAGVFFVLIALMFVGLGQEMGRKFNALPDRVWAYTTNILGSLAGIVVFGIASYSRTTPLHWFAVSLMLCALHLPRLNLLQVASLAASLVVVGDASDLGGEWSKVIWSPYYKVEYNPRTGDLITNNIGHQTMQKSPEIGSGYALPHLLNRDAGGKPFEDVLIIGAGSGNDVQAALGHGAKHVDAVEIEPVLNEIGRANHPDRPYDDPRVAIHLDDGRSYLRKPGPQYDLAIYALVDSLVLHSGYSSLRLESFLFTEQAFRDVKARLKPGGVFAMYNFYRQGWVVGRLTKMAENVFGAKPIVISLPYQPEITPRDDQFGCVTFLLVGNTGATAVESIRRALEEKGSFWINSSLTKETDAHGYSPEPPALAGTHPGDWQKIGLARVETKGIDRLPTDDWPFLYLRDAAIPGLSLRGMVLIAGLSLALLWTFVPDRRTFRPDGRMLFLGAGFMLLETKGVVHLALLFGSTWVVNSIVFFAILVMILLSNLFVLAARPKALWPFYGLLIGALLGNANVPTAYFLSLPGMTRVAASCAVVFVPVFFAGVIFAASFRASARPDVAFGSNIAGAILGGLSEYFSMVLGFDHLLDMAIAFYLLSAVLAPKRAQGEGIGKVVPRLFRRARAASHVAVER